ncbi:GNAT family N-acetyltransferase [Sphaerisporangium aureirubrum]|uniref:GNAT family N-acetyltransferase n=1 Tax=Sphaerisporangium aureirubrum TaxID=1544736 RepID=A0ABW1NPH0_9ACTN
MTVPIPSTPVPRELTRPADVAAATGGDLMTFWAVQGSRPGVRVFACGDAVAVASPVLSRRDRLVVSGPLAHAVPLVRHALAEAGAGYRPLGEEHLVRGLAGRVPGLELSAAFDWMRTAAPAPGDPGKAGWLAPEDDPEVTALLAEVNPGSYAVPGLPGVRRWAGVRSDTGAVASVAADAWSTPGAGFIAGVATAAGQRRLGHAEAVCRFLVTTLLAEHGRVALMVDSGNHTAIGVYHRLGFTRHPVAAAHVAAPG